MTEPVVPRAEEDLGGLAYPWLVDAEAGGGGGGSGGAGLRECAREPEREVRPKVSRSNPRVFFKKSGITACEMDRSLREGSEGAE